MCLCNRYTSPDGSSALHVAAQDGLIFFFEFRATESVGYSSGPWLLCVWLCITTGHAEILELLINETKLKEPNALNSFLRQNVDIHPFFLATQRGHEEVVRLLAHSKVRTDGEVLIIAYWR